MDIVILLYLQSIWAVIVFRSWVHLLLVTTFALDIQVMNMHSFKMAWSLLDTETMGPREKAIETYRGLIDLAFIYFASRTFNTGRKVCECVSKVHKIS